MQYCYYDEEDPQVQLAHIAAFTEVTPEGYNLSDYLVLLVSEDENGFYVELDKDSEIGWYTFLTVCLDRRSFWSSR